MCHRPLQPTLGRLGCSCSAMKSHHIKILKVWISLVIESWWPLHYPQHPLSDFVWPTLRGWVAVNCFHFVIKPLTADCAMFSSEEISRTDLMHRWLPVTVPCWNSPSSSMTRCLIWYTCGHGSDPNTWIQWCGHVSEHFWWYSVYVLGFYWCSSQILVGHTLKVFLRGYKWVSVALLKKFCF